jgi:hypothetical protein
VDDPAEVSSASSSSSKEKAASEHKLEALTINAEESTINKFLDEPHDFNIKTVESLSLDFRYKKVDRFRSLSR